MKSTYYTTSEYSEIPKKLKSTIQKSLAINFNEEQLYYCVWSSNFQRFIIITHKRVICCKKFSKIEQNYLSDLTGVEKTSDLKPNIKLLSSSNKTYLFDKSQIPTDKLINQLFLLIDEKWRNAKDGKTIEVQPNQAYSEFINTKSSKVSLLKNLTLKHYIIIVLTTGIISAIILPSSSESSQSKITKPKIKTNTTNQSKIDINAIRWSNNLSKQQILGDWYQIGWYTNNNPNGWNTSNINDGEYFFDGNSEQKKLTLTQNTYQTFYHPFKTENANILLNYSLNKNKMNVFLKGKINTHMYSYKITLSTDKKFLKLNDKSNTKIYRLNNAKN